MRALVIAMLFVSAAHADEELVSLHVSHDPLVRGRATTLSLGVALGAGLRLLDDAPLVVELDAVALQPAKRVLYRRDAVDPRADLPRFEIEVKADRAGTPSLHAKLTAWVCRGQRCRAVERVIDLPLEEKP